MLYWEVDGSQQTLFIAQATLGVFYGAVKAEEGTMLSLTKAFADLQSLDVIQVIAVFVVPWTTKDLRICQGF